ncbi:MAG TPA: FecR domain-containing protein [Terriglobia bacterium]|nr:FecR domain-containing protein [Terriglobia bacterium]
MSSQKKLNDPTAEEIAAGIRAESLEDGVVKQASQRVWARVSGASGLDAQEVGHIRGCADFQAMIPAYLAHTLPEARALLVQDHVLECVDCRHALSDAKVGVRHQPSASVSDWTSAAWVKPRRPLWTRGWALAAVLLAGIGLGLLGVGRWLEGQPVRGVVEAVKGAVYQVSDGGIATLASGHAIAASQEIRTAPDSSAEVRLADGSRVEMSERADLWFSRSWRGTTVHLERGNIIVRAAPQNHGRLYVATRDCLVSVKGTIFDVDEGMKGSRVSVIQGVVQVTQGGKMRLLNPGQQLTTQASLGQVPVSQEVAWSANSGEYLALLGEFSALRQQLETIPGPAPRYDSALLKMVPENTVFYAAIPNIGPTLSQANQMFLDRIQQSPVLQQWWSQQQTSGDAQKTQEMIDRIRAFSDYLGDEVVIAMPADHQSPLLLAEVKRPDIGAFLQGQLSELNGEKGPGALLVTNPMAIAAGAKNRMLIYVKNNLLVAATDASQLQKAAAMIGGGGSTGFASTPFAQAIQKAYQGGAGWLLCADMEQIFSKSVHQGEPARKGYDLYNDSNAGLADMRYLIMESKDVGGQSQNRATLTFAQERRGVASWLAEPSPLGTLDFVSPAASLAVSFAVKQPRDIVQDIINMGQASDPKFAQGLTDFETESGLDVKDDLAAAIGGEVTFAVDGPLLPTPSWKVAIEVNDSTRLEGALEKLVAGFNQEAANHHGGRASLTQTAAGGRTYYDLQITPGARPSGAKDSGAATPTDIHYVFVDGYLLAAPSQALLLSSIQNRDAGYTLARSSQFASRLPVDGYANPSGVVYQNLWSAVAPIANQLESSAALTPAQRQSLAAIGQNSAPSLICAYGEPDRIVVAGTGNIFGIGFESLFGMRGAGPFDLLPMIESAGKHAANGSPGD